MLHPLAPTHLACELEEPPAALECDAALLVDGPQRDVELHTWSAPRSVAHPVAAHDLGSERVQLKVAGQHAVRNAVNNAAEGKSGGAGRVKSKAADAHSAPRPDAHMSKSVLRNVTPRRFASSRKSNSLM